MNTTVRCGAVVALLMLSVACESSRRTSPIGISQLLSLPSPTPRPPTNFPSLSGPSRTFVFDGELSYRVSDNTKKSRFVLYDSGAFLLLYQSGGRADSGYRGQYQVANGVIMFMFEFRGRSIADQWDATGTATGTLKGDSLTLQYDEIMKHADFEDSVYVLMP